MKTVIEMAQSVGFWQEHVDTWMCNTKDIERFTELVRADEREACLHAAEVAVSLLSDPIDAIRARGQK